jgi:hypothetical protein
MYAVLSYYKKNIYIWIQAWCEKEFTFKLN